MTVPETSPGPGPGPAQAAPRSTSRLAIAGFVLALFPICLNLIGVILGIVAAVKISKDRQTRGGMGLAIAAIVIGLAWIPVGGILAAIAIPNFIRFQSLSKQSEAKSNLRALYTGVRAYEAETGAYSDDFQTIGFSPDPNTRYTYYFGASTIEAVLGEVAPLPADLQTGVTEDGFLAAAVGNIDGDATLDVWVIDAEGIADNLVNDVRE